MSRTVKDYLVCRALASRGTAEMSHLNNAGRAMLRGASQSAGPRLGAAHLGVLLTMVVLKSAAGTLPLFLGRSASASSLKETSVRVMHVREARRSAMKNEIVVDCGQIKVLNHSTLEAWDMTVCPCTALADRGDRESK
jgi:hypothetical protein